MSNRTLFHWATLVVVGCGGESIREDASMDTAPDIFNGTGGADDSASVEENSSQGAWWRMHASLVIEKGNLSLADSFFDVEVLDEGRNSLCTGYGPVSEAIREKETPHETIQYWWSVELEGWTGTCKEMGRDESLPVSFQLGMGVMHPEILAVLDKLDEVESGAEQLLYSAFASFDSGGSVFVFGAAGTEQDFAGEPGKVEKTELSGNYYIHPLYPFSLQAE